MKTPKEWAEECVSVIGNDDLTASQVIEVVIALALAEAGREVRDALKYAGFGEDYPFNRLPQLLQAKASECRNQDDRDYWRFVEEKLAAIINTP